MTNPVRQRRNLLTLTLVAGVSVLVAGFGDVALAQDAAEPAPVSARVVQTFLVITV